LFNVGGTPCLRGELQICRLPLATSAVTCIRPIPHMFWNRDDKADKEQQRFYLLPGMGGRAYRRKQKVILQSSVAVGVLLSALIAVALYLLNRPHP
jgi:hypothetical protein